MERSGNTPFQQLSNEAWRIPKDFLESRMKTQATLRWIGTLVISLIYCLRLYYIRRFYVITSGLIIYLTNLELGFSAPRVGNKTGPDMLKPFVRLLPEFEFWYSVTMAVLIVFLMTFFPLFDIPWVFSIDVFFGICFIILMAYSTLRWDHLSRRKCIISQDGGSKKSS